MRPAIAVENSLSSMISLFSSCTLILGASNDYELISPSEFILTSFASNNNFLGFSIAMDGDTMVIGAYFDKSNATGNNGD